MYTFTFITHVEASSLWQFVIISDVEMFCISPVAVNWSIFL